MDGNTFSREIWTSLKSNELKSWAQTIFKQNAFNSKCIETIIFYRANFIVVWYAVDRNRRREYTTYLEVSKSKLNSRMEAAFLNVFGKHSRFSIIFMEYSNK